MSQTTTEMPHQMETFRIPGTNLNPSRIGLGTWAIGGWMWGGTDEAESIRTIHAALDRGITLIDTAPVYGFGRSEEIVGKALAEGGRRARAVIATKVGLEWHDEQSFRNASRARIRRRSRTSLRRLQTDTIDLYQVHWPDPHTPIEETAAAMARSPRGRKDPRHRRQQFQPARRWTRSAPWRRCTPCSRPTISSSARSRRTCCPIAREHGLATLAYGALCRGLLVRPDAGRHHSPTTICAAQPIRNSSRRILPNISPPSPRSIASRSKSSANGSSTWRCAGCSIARQHARALGRAAPGQLDPVDDVLGWRSMPRRWLNRPHCGRSTCARRSARNSWRRRRRRRRNSAVPGALVPRQRA